MGKKIRCQPRTVKHIVRYLDAGGNIVENPPEQQKTPGRPRTYDRSAVIDYVCSQLTSSSVSLAAILRGTMPDGSGLPNYSEIMSWILDDPTFSEKYTRAREYQADFLFDELVEIADDCRNDWMERNDPTNPGYVANRELVARTKLRLDTRKWCASKLKPKKYGERMDVSVQGEMVLATLTLEQLEDRLARLQQATVNPAPQVGTPPHLPSPAPLYIDGVLQSAQPDDIIEDSGDCRQVEDV